MAIYMKYGNIKGAVTTQGYADQIELTSFQFGVGRGIASAARSAAAREASEPSLSEITVSKLMDVSSTKMFIEGVASELNNKVTITFSTTTKNRVTDYLVWELQDVGLSGYSITGSGEGLPTESLSLNFTKISMRFISLDAAVSGSPEIVGYDLTQMKTM
jgi:type VI secretion system secreted protein Hcp